MRAIGITRRSHRRRRSARSPDSRSTLSLEKGAYGRTLPSAKICAGEILAGDRMSRNTAEQSREMVDAVYRSDSRRVFATLVRVLGDFDLAEDALHDAFAAALEQWTQGGVPANPRAWLVSTGRFKAIDRIRRRARFDAWQAELANELGPDAEIAPEPDEHEEL